MDNRNILLVLSIILLIATLLMISYTNYCHQVQITSLERKLDNLCKSIPDHFREQENLINHVNDKLNDNIDNLSIKTDRDNTQLQANLGEELRATNNNLKLITEDLNIILQDSLNIKTEIAILSNDLSQTVNNNFAGLTLLIKTFTESNDINFEDAEKVLQASLEKAVLSIISTINNLNVTVDNSSTSTTESSYIVRVTSINTANAETSLSSQVNIDNKNVSSDTSLDNSKKEILAPIVSEITAASETPKVKKPRGRPAKNAKKETDIQIDTPTEVKVEPEIIPEIKTDETSIETEITQSETISTK